MDLGLVVYLWFGNGFNVWFVAVGVVNWDWVSIHLHTIEFRSIIYTAMITHQTDLNLVKVSCHWKYNNIADLYR